MRLNVWDIPTRLVHWLLAAAFFVAFYTSRTEWHLDYHTVAGWTAMGLVIFRVIWGVGGNRYARFSEFVRGLDEVFDYLGGVFRGRPRKYLGHNPAAGTMVVILLTMVGTLTVTGALSYWGVEREGLLAGVIGFNTATHVAEFHKFVAWATLAFVAVHVAAALVHVFVFRDNVIGAMFTGAKVVEDDAAVADAPAVWPGVREERTTARSVAFSFAAVAVVASAVLLPPQSPGAYAPAAVMGDEGAVAFVSPVEPWKEECAGSCHRGFHPTLLPAASWVKVMNGLEDHFGDDATIDRETHNEILGYLLASPAEASTTEASWKILDSLARSEVPGSITGTPFWKTTHSGIPEEVFDRDPVSSASNCLACHPGAEAGSFRDRDIRIPD